MYRINYDRCLFIDDTVGRQRYGVLNASPKKNKAGTGRNIDAWGPTAQRLCRPGFAIRTSEERQKFHIGHK